MIHVAIPPLQRQAPFQRLDVIEHGLGFDADPPSAALDHGIPRSQIGRDRQGDFGRPSQPGIRPRAEPLEQPGLPGIADRVSGGIGLQPHVQTYDGTKRGDIDRRQLAERPSFESPDSGVIDPGRRSDRPKAQAGSDSRPPLVSRNGLKVRPGASSTAVAGPLACAHPPTCSPATINCGLSAQPILLRCDPQVTKDEGG